MNIAESGKRKALGKGLETLLPGARIPGPSSTLPQNSDRAQEVPLSLIDLNPYQTRGHIDEVALAELAASIAANGVLQPVLLRPVSDGRYQLIAGERRWRASQIAGQTTVPAVIRHVSDQQALEMTIVENLQRSDLSAMEQARAYERLAREFSMTQEQMARRTGKDRASVANFLRLLRLPAEVQQRIDRGELSFGHAKVLLMLEDAEAIQRAAARVTALAMSVRQTETYIQGILHPERKSPPETPTRAADPNVRAAEEQLRRTLGLKVTIKDKKGRGRIVIEYGTIEDFDRVLESLAAPPPAIRP